MQLTIEQIEESADERFTDSQRKRAKVLLDGVLGWTHRNVPCLRGVPTVDGIEAEARMIITEAVLRAVAAGYGNTASDSTGPDAVSYFDRASKPTLTGADEAALKALCPPRRRQQFGTIRTRLGY